MKNVIIYGIRNTELRKNISFFLGNQYRVIGYTDSNYHCDVVGGERFIRLEELGHINFDLIVLASFRENALHEMRQTVLSMNISEEKIVYPMMFLQQDAEKCQLDIISDIDNNYRGEPGLIFGLSYSLWDIRKKGLDISFYDCSWHGLDMYYNFQIYRYMVSHKSLSNARIALLVFPYYYFNFDMSRSMYHYKTGQIFSVWQLNDWHNYALQPGTRDYVENYKMFGEKISKFYHSNRYEMESKRIFQGTEGGSVLERIWFAHYKDTVDENKAIFFNFLLALKQQDILPFLVVPPLFVKGIDSESMVAFQKKKEQFYVFLREAERKFGRIPLADYADVFAEKREYFSDLTHLNSYGAKNFTLLINNAISELR